MPARDEIDRDVPLRLHIAAALAYPDGTMTASGLRNEAQKGRLVIERTAGKDYVTMAEIELMRKRCRVEAEDHGSGCARPNMTVPENSPIQPSGTLKMVDTAKALDAALTTVAGLKGRLLTTSPASTSPAQKPACARRPPSRSRTS
jgi:hypothetical protein